MSIGNFFFCCTNVSVLILQLWNLGSARVDDNLHKYLGPLCKGFDVKKDYGSVLGAEGLLKTVVCLIFTFVFYTLLFFFLFFPQILISLTD